MKEKIYILDVSEACLGKFARAVRHSNMQAGISKDLRGLLHAILRQARKQKAVSKRLDAFSVWKRTCSCEGTPKKLYETFGDLECSGNPMCGECESDFERTGQIIKVVR